MERTPTGTPVGVDDPYAHVDRCDHLTDDGRCRFAIERASESPRFAENRRSDGFSCVVAMDGRRWVDCRHFRSSATDADCARCGLTEHRVAHAPDRRPLLETHHLSYPEGGQRCSHEITVVLCRWCHAKVHNSWARITDEVRPDPEAIAEREQRVAAERSEAAFRTAADRFSQ